MRHTVSTHYGVAIGSRVVEVVGSITSDPAEVIHLYAGDKNRVRVRFEDGTEGDFTAEFCRPAK